MLAQNGLNDPKLRQQMNPAEREAYLELLEGADVQKISRGEWKSVRVVFAITAKFLDIAQAKSAVPPAIENANPSETATKNAGTDKSRTKRKK